MILSVSRRTDVPAFYAPWFFNRLKAGYACARNPMNPRQVSRVSLSPDVVDAIVFWTKNPLPMLGRLRELSSYMYYFQFTLTGYGPDVEPGLPSKRQVLVPAFQRLSQAIGPDRVIWRYDPIFLSDTYTPAYHRRAFAALAQALAPFTRTCTISFLDHYRKTERNMAPLSLRPFPPEQQLELAEAMAAIARRHGLQINTCAESLELSHLGIGHARCIDPQLLERLLGCPLHLPKDKNQRPACGCAPAVDIGAYNTCRHGCRYCYANFSASTVAAQSSRHDPASPLLVGSLLPEDKVVLREGASCRERQLRFPE